MRSLHIIKIGGNIIDDPQQLAAFLERFAAIEGFKMLVHGGGKIATSMGAKLGIESRYIDGRRITDENTLGLVTMVYGGLINKRIVAALQASGCNAIGLTGADGNSIMAMRRPAGETDYGFVGDISTAGVNVPFLVSLLEAGIAPVFAPLTHDGAGSMLNTNADTIAQELAVALSERFSTRLIYCFEKSGVLRDAADEQSVIASIDATAFRSLQAEGIVAGGMIPKLSNAFAAREAGVHSIVIGNAVDLPELITRQKGTLIA